MREAGSGRAGMAPRRSFPSARRTERRHRSMSGRGSAEKTRRERRTLAKLGRDLEQTVLMTSKVNTELTLVEFNKQIINK